MGGSSPHQSFAPDQVRVLTGAPARLPGAEDAADRNIQRLQEAHESPWPGLFGSALDAAEEMRAGLRADGERFLCESFANSSVPDEHSNQPTDVAPRVLHVPGATITMGRAIVQGRNGPVLDVDSQASRVL